MTTDSDDPQFQWIQAIHRDLAHLRDNHIHTMSKDINNIKRDIVEIKDDVDELKSLKDDAMNILRRYSGRIMLGVIIAVGASLGAPIAVDQI